MSSLRKCLLLTAIVTAFALTGCGLQQLGSPSDQDGDDPAVEVDRSISALAGGVSEHMTTDYARAEVWGTGEVDGSCHTYEVVAIVYDRTTMDVGGPTDRQWVWVRVREFCCDREELYSTWTGSVNLDDADFTLDVYPNRHHLWSASVDRTVTVRNTADRSQTMDLDLNLVWDGVNDFRHRAENRWLDDEHVYNYELLYEMAMLSGEVGLPGVTFTFDSQMRVWIGDENRTIIDR